MGARVGLDREGGEFRPVVAYVGDGAYGMSLNEVRPALSLSLSHRRIFLRIRVVIRVVVDLVRPDPHVQSGGHPSYRRGVQQPAVGCGEEEPGAVVRRSV